MLIPEFEPEVIAAGARRYFGDTEKVATTALPSVVVHGVRCVSRYGKARELRLMSKLVERLHAAWPALGDYVSEIFCDSKAGATFSIEVEPETSIESIEALADSACRYLVEDNGGHNGVWITVRGVSVLDCDPGWVGDEEV